MKITEVENPHRSHETMDVIRVGSYFLVPGSKTPNQIYVKTSSSSISNNCVSIPQGVEGGCGGCIEVIPVEISEIIYWKK